MLLYTGLFLEKERDRPAEHVAPRHSLFGPNSSSMQKPIGSRAHRLPTQSS